MAEPNISREELQKLEFVGRQGNQLIYRGADQKLVMLGAETVNQMGMPVRSRKRLHAVRFDEEDVWSGSRSAHSRDKMATTKLLQILKNHQAQGDMFSSRRMRKKELWVEIANELMADGFNFRNRDNAWEKVSQKWRNMERSYRVYIESMRKSKYGAEPSKPLEFFDDLHELLAVKYNTAATLENYIEETTIGSHSRDNSDEASYYANGDDENSETVTADQGPELYAPEEEREDEEQPQLETDFETYMEEEEEPPRSPLYGTPLSPSNSVDVDDKNLVHMDIQHQYDIQPSNDPNTAGIRDPVLRMLIEMRAQERAHFREDRRERLNMQREMLEFRRDLVNMLERQHNEKMEVMRALVVAISSVSDSSSQESVTLNGHKDTSGRSRHHVHK